MGLRDRLKKLEGAAPSSGSSGCERCGDTLVVLLGGDDIIVSRRGQEFPRAAALAFVKEEEPNGRCPLCGTLRRTIGKVGSYGT